MSGSDQQRSLSKDSESLVEVTTKGSAHHPHNPASTAAHWLVQPIVCRKLATPAPRVFEQQLHQDVDKDIHLLSVTPAATEQSWQHHHTTHC